MTRTTAREIAVRLAFGLDAHQGEEREAVEGFFDEDYYSTLGEADELYADYPDDAQKSYIEALVCGVADKRPELDALIEKYARGWKARRISRMALSLLRCAVYETMYMDDIPASVAINEAVEMAKGYEEQETVSFINGVLGGIVRGEIGKPETEPEAEPAVDAAAEDTGAEEA